MKVCPYCRTDLPDDTIYCSHCGKPIEEHKEASIDKNASKKERADKQRQVQKDESAPKNVWISFGIILFLVGLIGFDFILGMIFNSMHWNYKIIYIISTVLYIGAIVCGVMALVKDHRAKKQGISINSNYPMATAEIVISLYIILVNMQQIVMK